MYKLLHIYFCVQFDFEISGLFCYSAVKGRIWNDLQLMGSTGQDIPLVLEMKRDEYDKKNVPGEVKSKEAVVDSVIFITESSKVLIFLLKDLIFSGLFSSNIYHSWRKLN